MITDTAVMPFAGDVGDDCVETPSYVFEVLNSEFNFTLDVCASITNKKCELFYSETDDGLTQKWSGTAYCNPPYSNIEEWIAKGISEINSGNLETIVYLLPSRTDTRWFKLLIDCASEIIFIRGRIKFENKSSVAPFPSLVAVFRRKKPDSVIISSVQIKSSRFIAPDLSIFEEVYAHGN